MGIPRRTIIFQDIKDSGLLIFQDVPRFQQMIFRTVLRFQDSSNIIQHYATTILNFQIGFQFTMIYFGLNIIKIFQDFKDFIEMPPCIYRLVLNTFVEVNYCWVPHQITFICDPHPFHDFHIFGFPSFSDL